jgi:ribosomal protein L32
MPAPKRKTCRWKRDQRRSHIKMTAADLIVCEEAGGIKVPRKLLRAYKEGLIK